MPVRARGGPGFIWKRKEALCDDVQRAGIRKYDHPLKDVKDCERKSQLSMMIYFSTFLEGIAICCASERSPMRQSELFLSNSDATAA